MGMYVFMYLSIQFMDINMNSILDAFYDFYLCLLEF